MIPSLVKLELGRAPEVEVRILAIFTGEISSTPDNLNLQGKLRKDSGVENKGPQIKEKRCLLFSIITVYIFFKAYIKWLLQNILNGLDRSTLFVSICHVVLAGVVFRNSSYRG